MKDCCDLKGKHEMCHFYPQPRSLLFICVMVAGAVSIVLGAMFIILSIFPLEDISKPRLVGYGCVYQVEANPDTFMFVEGPTYADEEDQFPVCVTIKVNE